MPNQKKPTVEEELDQIKRLLVFLLLKMGATQGEVGKALGSSQASVSRMIGKVEPWKK